MTKVHDPLHEQQEDEYDNLVTFPGLDEANDANDAAFERGRTRGMLRIMEAVAWLAAAAISVFIILFTVLSVMTVLNGGVVPVGSGGTGAVGVIRGLILLYTEGVGIAITVGVMALAVAAPLLLLPRRRTRRS